MDQSESDAKSAGAPFVPAPGAASVPPGPVPPRPSAGPTPTGIPSPGGIPDYILDWSAFTALAPLAAVYGKAFLERLAERTADGVMDAPGKLRRRWLRRRRPGSRTPDIAAVLETEDGRGAAILVTADLPDEARLALLDLNPADPALRGRILGWDNDLRQWVPIDPDGDPITPPEHLQD
ncbi:hypothetical protein [Nocardia brasiliensis]|uniref:hypothetical protein n=1 Tax=Nocardia brasiliensis TaxID=37326 RepID=UPI00366E8B0B